MFYYYYYYLRFALFYVAQENDPARLYPLASPRLNGGLRQHFITPCRGLRHHSVGLHWPCYVTTSVCRDLRSATSGPGWGMEPCPASSSKHVINTEHINQLSRFHAQSFKFLICVWFDYTHIRCLLKETPFSHVNWVLLKFIWAIL